MMNIVYIAQITGTVSIFLLFVVKLYIVASPKAWAKSGRAAVLWTSIYIFFLFALRVMQLIGVGTQEQLRIISGFTAAIPLAGVLAHLFLLRQLPPAEGSQASLQEAQKILLEAKRIKHETEQTLADIRKVAKL